MSKVPIVMRVDNKKYWPGHMKCQQHCNSESQPCTEHQGKNLLV